MTISDLLQVYIKHRRAFLSLSFFLFLVFMIGFSFSRLRAYEADAITYDPLWIKCDQDKSCTAVPGACGEWVPVNTESVEKAGKYYKKLATLIECVSTIDRPSMPAVLCMHEKCTFGIKGTE